MKRPAVFFDRDNTLIVSDGYLGDPAQVKLIEGAAEAIAKARQLGFVCVTISNQSGVARGMFDEEAVAAVNRRMDELLQQARPAATIARHEYCPYHPEAPVERYRQESELRKPRPGMILSAAEKLNLDLSRSWVIGDAPRDIEAGHAAGCRTILFTDPNLAASPATAEPLRVEPDFRAGSLRQAMEIVAREAFRKMMERKQAHAPAASRTPETAPRIAEVEEGSEATAVVQETATAQAEGEEIASSPPLAIPGISRPVMLDVSACGTAAPGCETGPQPRAAVPHDVKLESGEGGPTTKSSAPPVNSASATRKTDALLEQILAELKRRREEPHADFSVSKLFAGIVQVLAVGAMFLAYLNRDGPRIEAILLSAILLQTFTIALLIMGKQK